jgi:cell division protein FtsN
MSKDYKRPDPKPRGSGSSFFLGMLTGLVLGLGIALAVAWYLNKAPSPFLSRPPAAKTDPAKAGAPAKPDEKKSATAQGEKPRFDFYKILPGTEETATDQQLKDAQKKSTAGARETFYLQAGAFQNAQDADSLKARLALIGFEATIQAATLPDKGVWHRVRVGPYTSVEELTRMRDALRQNGVETTLIKVRD